MTTLPPSAASLSGEGKGTDHTARIAAILAQAESWDREAERYERLGNVSWAAAARAHARERREYARTLEAS